MVNFSELIKVSFGSLCSSEILVANNNIIYCWFSLHVPLNTCDEIFRGGFNVTTGDDAAETLSK